MLNQKLVQVTRADGRSYLATGPFQLSSERVIRTPLLRQCVEVRKGEWLTVNGECTPGFGSSPASPSAGNSNPDVALFANPPKGAMTWQ